MLSRFRLSAALSAVVIQFIPARHTAATAQEYEGCFMVNSSGQVVNLNTLCVEQESAPNSVADKGFIEDYKRLSMPYPPNTRDYLLKGIETSAKQKIATAKKVCESVKSGITIAEWRLRTLNEARQMENATARDTFLADMEVIISIAPNYYCPEFAGQ